MRLYQLGKLGSLDAVTLGTGGVSLFAVQLALIAGAKVIATTGSDAKVERLWKLGVSEVINYRTTPDWDVRVRELTGGRCAAYRWGAATCSRR